MLVINHRVKADSAFAKLNVIEKLTRNVILQCRVDKHFIFAICHCKLTKDKTTNDKLQTKTNKFVVNEKLNRAKIANCKQMPKSGEIWKNMSSKS